MTAIIPFISQIDKAEQINWIKQLNTLIPEANIVPASEISPYDKPLCHLAIVADPDPIEVSEFTGLIWVQSLWAGVERLMKAFRDESFGIVRLIDPQLSQTMAEAALAWSLYLHRDMPAYRQQQSKQQWQQLTYTSASERTIGVLGLGALGQISAVKLAEQGFNVLGWSQHQKIIKGITTYCDESGLTEMLAKCDIVICLLPLTRQTKHLLNTQRLAVLPKGASVINFARGGIINSDDLLKLLDSGHLNHAVLDVFEHEPLEQSSDFWQHNKITVLPHISAPTIPGTACKIVAQNINRYFESGTIPKTVNMKQGY